MNIFKYGDFFLDINECNSNNGVCEHNCRDTDGSYTCSCNRGFRLSVNGLSCYGKL